MKIKILAAALAVLSILFVGCNKEVAPDATLAEKLMGRWTVSASFNALSVINN